MIHFPKLLPAVVLAAGIFSPIRLPAQTAPIIKLDKITGGYSFSTTGRAGYLYYAEHSADGENWTFLSSMKLGNGSPVTWNFAAPEPNVKRQLYRIRESATGGYTATSAAAQDSDGDGLKDMDELGNALTNPFSTDTDGDGIDDLSEYLSGLNPREPDDSSPGEFIVQWQRTDSASLAPKGWPSNVSSPVPPKPNYYRSITANAVEKRSSATSGQEFNTGKTMSIQRVLQTQTPLRFDPDGSGGYFPVYQEQVTYSYTVGQPFVSINSHLDPANWSTPAPGAFAQRAKWPGQSIYDYGWNYASPVTNQTLQGEFQEVILPSNVPGEAHTWANPPVAQGGNRYTQHSVGLDLPNRNFPTSGNVFPNATWAGAASASSDETAEGIKTTWTLGNRWTYADVRSELERLRNSLHSVFAAENWNVSLPGYAIRRQSAEGDAEVTTYEFRFQKVGGGVGATTLIWPEIFTPMDNPETPANEGTSPSVTRLRSVTLPPNTEQSVNFKVDPRVSNFTILPGESAPTGAIPFGSTEIGDLIEPNFELTEWNVTMANPVFGYFSNDPLNQPLAEDYICVGSMPPFVTPKPGPEQMIVSAKVKIQLPVSCPDSDAIASKYNLIIHQDILENNTNETRYQSGATFSKVSPVPGQDANWKPLENPNADQDEDSIPRIIPFSADNQTLSVRMRDSPGQKITLDPDYSFPGTSGPLTSAKQLTKFRTWLFIQSKTTKKRYYLKWFDWQINTHVKFNSPGKADDQILSLTATKTAEGIGAAPSTPVETLSKKSFIAIP